MTYKVHNALWYANRLVLWLNRKLQRVVDGTIR